MFHVPNFFSHFLKKNIMKIIQTNIFTPISVSSGQRFELVDIFSGPGKKTIELGSHSSLTYLLIWSDVDIHIQLTTQWPACSCTIFGLFFSDAKRPVTGSLKVSLNHSHTSANVELISFLYDGARVNIDWSIDIWKKIDSVHARLLEHNVVLGQNISLKTLPQLHVASANVRASHWANLDRLDEQKLFYMMSRGLSQQQSQQLLVDGYINSALASFKEFSEKELADLHKQLSSLQNKI